MGTTVWESTASAGQIIADELRPYNVRMWDTDREAAAVAYVIPFEGNDIERLRKTFKVKDGATSITTAMIIKHGGTLFNRSKTLQHPRTVSIKMMDEIALPYYTGGASKQFIGILTPLNLDAMNPDADAWCPIRSAKEWRDKALAAAQ